VNNLCKENKCLDIDCVECQKEKIDCFCEKDVALFIDNYYLSMNKEKK